ncbi:MAG: hypothetical protein SCH71_09700 [Desulfobulbaceae bacterium]|nr:hypothetical protein [Desulfobulbaceae bacterium]
MSDTDKRNPQERGGKKKSAPHLGLSIILLLLLVIAAGSGIFLFIGPKTDELPQAPDITQVAPEQTQPEEPEYPEAASEQDMDADQLTASREFKENEKIEEPGVPGPVSTDEPGGLQDEECELLGNKLYNFFIHIDSEEYIKPFALQESSQTHFIRLAYKLLDNPPVVIRESDDLYTILRNMAHFFRIIGKDNIFLIKAILDRERDKIEDVASELYQWMTMGTCQHDRFEFSAPPEKVYEYAGFFLNTMGGRSYLFRRDSRSRLLVNYYSILIVAGADARGINRYGIDISQFIPQLVQEIEATNQLIYKENYLDQLYGLLEQYQ